MELEIEIDKADVKERQVSTDRGPFTVREQAAWAKLPGDRYPQKLTIQLAGGTPPHRPGRYQLAPSSVTIDRFGRLQFKRHLDLEKLEE